MKKAAIAILLAQLAVIGAMIWRYERVVREGVEFRVPCRAYDPRNPWRGRFLRSDVRATVQAVTNHVIVAAPESYCERLGPGFVMVDRHSTTNIPPLLVYKDEEPTLKPPFWFRVDDVSAAGLSSRDDDIEPRWEITLPNKLYISDKIADRAEKILAGSTRNSATKRVMAVFRAYEGDVVIMDIEIDGIPISTLSKE